jgi:regulator of protease activity HflC (stomatin/prohibitin superfamily)
MERNLSGAEKLVGGFMVFLVILAFISILPWIGAWSIVSAGNVGVVTRLGAVQRVVNPGLVFKLPLIEGVSSMETRTQIEQVDASSASKDLQDVNAKIALNFHLRGEKAVEVYQNLGTEYKDRIIAPAMQEAFKAVTAQFTASDLIVKREEVKKLAYDELRTRLDKYNVIVDDFNIVNFDFSGDFNQAIEAKVRAQQELEQAKIEAQTKLTRAQGEVDAAKKLQEGGALSPIYIEFLRTQKWNGVLAPSGDGLFLNVQK